MEIYLSIVKANGQAGNKKDLDYLIGFLEAQSIKGLESLTVLQTAPELGDQGAGWAEAIKGLLTPLTAPLTKLAEALVEHVKNQRTTVKVKIGEAEIEISGKNPQKQQEMLNNAVAQLTLAAKELAAAKPSTSKPLPEQTKQIDNNPEKPAE
jgi:hypothetical protein